MLRKFKVSNFKCFKENLIFDFSDINGYNFSLDCIKNRTVNCGLVYGYNGCGKTNLGLAIFDIIEHITDKYKNEFYYRHYVNAESNSNIVFFSYEFLINNKTLKYEYGKTDYKTLVFETLWIDGEELIKFDRRCNNKFTIKLKGAESLNTIIQDPQLSVLKYVKNNSVLEVNDVNNAFIRFFEFVDNMLFFRSLEDRTYLGYDMNNEDNNLSKYIIEKNKVNEFENFLHEANINCKLTVVNVMGKEELAWDFGKKQVLFFDIESTGTSSLILFYYWYLKIINSKVSFVFIDEFDAFYHSDLSKLIVTKLKETGVQFILTTHNTSIMNNDIMRPDTLFLLRKNKILSLSKCSKGRELREAHNIEKIYKSGAFNIE